MTGLEPVTLGSAIPHSNLYQPLVATHFHNKSRDFTAELHTPSTAPSFNSAYFNIKSSFLALFHLVMSI